MNWLQNYAINRIAELEGLKENVTQTEYYWNQYVYVWDYLLIPIGLLSIKITNYLNS
jgi:hypothetical protein